MAKKGQKLSAAHRQKIMDGIAKAKSAKAKQLPVVHAEFPLDAIPERPAPVIRPKVSQEAALIGLCHRMLDQQERLLDLIEQKPKPRGKYKKHKVQHD